ncbi:ABC transporter substrate-binding protein [Halopenitus persicus]|uniref:Peptide/nickel transport system substrate-binding protein n=1 Tax=Halopenitus persicus TaxID=1048396 RepID=A0A1H3LGQ8_9EURY|nr:ABC transporter substrate-binding protein [Halopenitus persicus]SDY63339.1 peptide/nickel transport system substrate-binding protein [Halopenitus persicus]
MVQRQSTRRSVLKTGIGAAAGTTLLAGCTGQIDEVTGSTPGNNALRIATDSDPGSPLNIYVSSHSKFDWMKDLVYDRLLAPSPYVDEPMPGLAKETNQVDDTTWTATIRSDASWHDGEPFTADDVVFTYRYLRDGPPTRYAHHVSEAPHIETIEAVDEETVRFKCAYPCPTLADITFADLPIIPKHVWDDVEDPSKYAGLPVGTGPYELVEYESGSHLRFEANESYFMGEPLVNEVVIPIIQDHSALFTALQSGDIDTASVGLPPSTVNKFEQNDAFDLVPATTLSLVEIRINYERAPFDKHDFRWALSRGIDKKSIVDVVMLGKAVPGSEGYPHPKSPWTAQDIGQPYKPEEARATLDELGFRDRDGDGVRETPGGEELSFTLKVPSNQSSYIRAAELVAEDLTAIGLETTAKTLDPGAIGDLFSSRNFDMYISSITPHGVADPDQFVMSHRSGYLWDKEIEYPAWDSLFEDWKQTATVAERKEVLFEMQRLFNDQPTSLPLWYPEPRFAYRPEAHDKWAESPGFGIHHKWSLLPQSVRGASVTDSFE